MDILEEEYRYFQDHKEELLQKYDGKYLVIKNKSVLGAYNSEVEAYETTIKEHKLGSFLIQLCAKEDGEKIQTFHSRVEI